MSAGRVAFLGLILAVVAGCGEQETRTNSLGMEFVPVEGLPGVLFSKYETRNRDYRAFVKATGHRTPECAVGCGKAPWNTWFNGKPPAGLEDHPVVGVSWEDAQAFCRWMTGQERQERRIGLDQEYRLPTDWEWSMAVGLREGKSGSPASKNEGIKDVYPWNGGKGTWPPPKGAGNYAPSLNVDSFENTSPVGSFAANANGIYDLGGNVWEWCEDRYSSGSSFRVLRGGSWHNRGPRRPLSSGRGGGSPDRRDGFYGFRVGLGSSPK